MFVLAKILICVIIVMLEMCYYVKVYMVLCRIFLIKELLSCYMLKLRTVCHLCNNIMYIVFMLLIRTEYITERNI